MTAFSLTIPLIATKRSFKTKLFVVGGLLFLLVALASLFWAENNLKVYFFIAGLIFLWIGTLFKDYSKIGTINWDLDKIVIEDIAEIKTYHIQDLKNIEINLTGVEGEMYSIKTMAIKQGSNNYIRFDYHEESRGYQFFLDDSHVPFLRVILEEWKRNGVVFSLNSASWKFSS